ncbi:YceI family protein [Thiofilum flexile]|uniref:YceI family protein n=1 Tax=Thiofilum flexile TaxID=125627 RepID=UPI000373C286|nr:YceI family protein [Thiofilum flexile]
MKTLLASSLLALSLLGTQAYAADYKIDTEGMHSAIQFRIKHLGYSWLNGRFNDFAGTFSYDEAKPEDSKVSVTIKTASVDSNHAERDKHIRGTDFLNVEKFPEAKFESTAFKAGADGKSTIEGNLTLNGVTKPVTLNVESIGAGDDPWGGYRHGFEATTEFALADFGINYDLGPASKNVAMILSVEGIRQ